MLAGVLVLLLPGRCCVLEAAAARQRALRPGRLRGRRRLPDRLPLGALRGRLPARRRWRLAALALGVPLGRIVRWLVLGGADVWHLARIGPALGQTLGLGAGRGAC